MCRSYYRAIIIDYIYLLSNVKTQVKVPTALALAILLVCEDTITITISNNIDSHNLESVIAYPISHLHLDSDTD